MTHVTPIVPSEGDEANATDVSIPIKQIADVVNGDLDDSNINYVSGSKIVDGTVVTAKIADSNVTLSKLAGGGTDGVLVTSSGTVSSAKQVTVPYKFSAYRNAAWSTSTSAALVTFDAISFDTGSNYSTSTGKFTASVAGYYLFNVGIGYTSSTSSGGIVVYLYKNGSQVAVLSSILGQSAAWNSNAGGSRILQLSANDYIQVYVLSQGASVSGMTGANNTFFDGCLISL